MKPGQLHVHTRYSDGEVTPDMILRNDLGFVAITDHDYLSPIDAFRYLIEYGIEVISGIELTVVIAGKIAHVLVLEPRPLSGFFDALAIIQRQRSQRVQRILNYLEKEGFRLDGSSFMAHEMHTKWDIADAVLAHPFNERKLKQYGISDAKSFRYRFINSANPEFRISGIPGEEMLPLVKGIFILAHPGKSFRLEQDALKVCSFLKAFPFSGVEVITRKHGFDQQKHAALLALSCGLLQVTSNDAHVEAHLTQNPTPYEQLEQLRERAHMHDA